MAFSCFFELNRSIRCSGSKGGAREPAAGQEEGGEGLGQGREAVPVPLCPESRQHRGGRLLSGSVSVSKKMNSLPVVSFHHRA